MRSIRGPATPGRPPRVVVHVGAPLVGAPYVREALSRNRRRLTRHGVLHPSAHVGAEGHRTAVLDVLDLGAPGLGSVEGAWERLAQAARDWRRGTVVVSHELLADADEDQVQRVVGSFGNAEVHVVYAARDLARQLPLAWQEWVRNGGTATFEGYVDKVVRGDAHRLSRVFWRSHDVADVLARWGSVVPVDRLHLVTVPADADADETVWQRLCEVLGVPASRLRKPDRPASRLHALAATEALRLLNAAGVRRAPVELAAAVVGPAPAVPEAHARWLEGQAERAVEAVKSSGCAVHGDVTDLRSAPAALSADPARWAPADGTVVAAQTAMLAALLG